MASYTVEAFKWSGTFYDATYTTSYSVTFSDDDATYEGWSDGSETVSIDGGPPQPTSGPAYAIDVDFTDTAGDSHVETFNFFISGGEWYFVPGADSDFSVGATLGGYQSHTIGWDYDGIVCFAAGTRIETPAGPVAVERLQSGDRVCLADGRIGILRQRLSRRLGPTDLLRNPRLRPVLIRRGALGAGLPRRDLRVSRQHRMLIASRVAARMFGSGQALIPAIRLTGLPGIAVDWRIDAVRYEHLVFDAHEIVLAEGAPSESLFPGPEALRSLPAEARAELLALFPGLAANGGAASAPPDGTSPVPDAAAPTAPSRPEPARIIPRGRRQRQLILRLNRNGKPLLDPAWMPSAAPGAKGGPGGAR